jgi:hypothetical protein
MKTIDQIPTTTTSPEIDPVINEVPQAPQQKIEVKPRID